MTADIRTAAEAEAAKRTIEPNVDDPLPIDHHTFGWRSGFAWGAVWAAARVTPTREQITEVLRGIGLSNEPEKYDSNIHSWRCERPEIYGRCSCFDEAVNDFMVLLAGLAEGSEPGD